MPKLSVNIDHIATLREARKGREPDPVAAAVLAELAGADGITVHLREDRRHIQERDVKLLRQTATTRLNLEMAATPEMTQFAIDILPDLVTLVPENREELTTEGGLNIAARANEIEKVCLALKKHDIFVSIFIDPEVELVRAAKRAGADGVEFHTGPYCNAYDFSGDQLAWQMELAKVEKMVHMAGKLDLNVNAGHGLNYRNVGHIAAIAGIHELNIGHSIVSRAALVGLSEAVREMRRAMAQRHPAA